MFKFKGISSEDMQVIIEEEEHFIARAAQRYEMTEIEGRDGAIFDTLGYSVVERPIYVQCLDINKIDNILAWLNGEGEFEYKGRKTIARFYSELEPQRNTCIRIIDTIFIRNPFWTKVNDEYITVTDTVFNEGNIESRPIIRLEKTNSNTVDVTINGINLQYNFNEDQYVEMDCEDKTIEYEGLNRNRQMIIGYDFPKLNIGENTIIFSSGTSCTVKIKRKDRWL